MSEERFRCEVCRYWEPASADSIFGQCHRRAPSTAGDDANRWPVVAASDWCGEGISNIYTEDGERFI